MLKLFVLFLLTFSCCNAQTIIPASLNSAGQSAAINGNTISYVVGDYAVINLNDSSGSVSNSFFSGILITALTETETEKITVSVFPNPTAELIYIDLSELNSNQIFIRLSSIDGKLIINENYRNFNQRLQFDISKLNSGIYLLNINTEKEKETAVYKIVKQ